MAEKSSDSIEEKRTIEAQLKQDKKREEAEAKKEEAKAESASGKKEAKTAAAKDAKPAAGKKAEAKKEEKKFVLERVYSIPLSRAYRKSRSFRGASAMSIIKAFALRHAKALTVFVDPKVNDAVLSRGARRPPRSVRVDVRKDEAGVAFVYLAKI